MLCVEGGRVVCPTTGRDESTDVLIDGGEIVEVGEGLASQAEHTVRAEGAVVCPGFVDLIVETNDPGDVHREDLRSAASAAAAGGFTTIIATPDTTPAVDNGSVAADIISRADALPNAHLLVAGSLTVGCSGVEMAEIGTLADVGCAAFSDGGHLIDDVVVLRNALDYARRFERPILLRAGQGSLESKGSAHEGLVAMQLGLRGIPDAAEEMGVARLIALARLTQARVHITHVTTARAVQMIAAARADGLDLTASTTIHHLALADKAIDEESYDANLRFVPPLRDESNRQAIVQAIRTHDWFCVATDHRPRALAEKEHEFERTAIGAIGLETALPATLSALRGDVNITVQALASRPASVLGQVAAIRPGAPANLTIFDPSADVQIDIAGLRSKCHNTPFLGKRMLGRVVGTICGGQISESLG